jgi:hypothetical protein
VERRRIERMVRRAWVRERIFGGLTFEVGCCCGEEMGRISLEER